jgi:hypothetical protein
MSGGDYPDRDPQLFYELARDRHAGQAALLDSLDDRPGCSLISAATHVQVGSAYSVLTRHAPTK